MNLGRFDHLLHHRCLHCYRRGYLAAASEAKDRELRIKALLNAGLDPWQLEQSLRERIAAAEQEAA